jgi:WYL domain-containing protein
MQEVSGRPLTIELTGTERVVRATLEHRMLRFNYAGHPRTVEPQLVGIHENGEPLLVAFQTGGTSSTGAVPGWRTFRTSELDAVEVGDETFPGLRLDFELASHPMVEIFARA